jgi:hypothetical protein
VTRTLCSLLALGISIIGCMAAASSAQPAGSSAHSAVVWKAPHVPAGCGHTVKYDLTGHTANLVPLPIGKQSRANQRYAYVVMKYEHDRDYYYTSYTMVIRDPAKYVGCMYFQRDDNKSTFKCTPGGDQPFGGFTLTNVAKGVTCVNTREQVEPTVNQAPNPIAMIGVRPRKV